MHISDENKQFLFLFGGMFSGFLVQIIGQSLIAFIIGVALMFSPFIYVMVIQSYWVEKKYLHWNVLETITKTQKEGVKHKRFYFRILEEERCIHKGFYDVYENTLEIMRKDIFGYGHRTKIYLQMYNKWQERFNINEDWIDPEGYEFEHPNVYHCVLLETSEPRTLEADANPLYWVQWASGDGGFDYYAHYLTEEDIKKNPDGALKRIQYLERLNFSNKGLISELTQRLGIAEYQLQRLTDLVNALMRAVKSITDMARDFIADLVMRTGSLEGALKELTQPTGFPKEILYIIFAFMGLFGVIAVFQPQLLTNFGLWLSINFIYLIMFAVIVVLGIYILFGGRKRKR